MSDKTVIRRLEYTETCEHGLVNAHDYLFGVVGRIDCPGGIRRDATHEDVLAAVRELGGVEVWWCEEHKSSGVGPIGNGPLPQSLAPGCDFAMMYVASEDRLPENRCHISAALIVPLDTGDTE